MPQLQFNVNWPNLVSAHIVKVQAALEANEVGALFVNNIENVRYLTGYSPVSSPGLVHSDWAIVAGGSEDPIVYTLPFWVDAVHERATWLRDVRPLAASMPHEIAQLVSERGLGSKRVAFDGYLSYTAGSELARLLPTMEFVEADPILAEVRAVKSADELAILERGAAIAEIGMKAAIEACIAGTMEYEVAAAAEYAMRRAGAEGFPFSSVVASGENAVLLQELATDAFLRHGDLVMLDLGCLFEGYHCEFARTAAVGGSPSAEMRDAYDVVHAALAAMIGSVRPGAPCSEPDRVGRRVLRDAGYAKWEPKYFIGHGIGMTHWEPPIIEMDATGELQPGMVLCFEPGIHKPGLGGIRLEDVVVVADDGCRVLTRTAFWDD